LYQESNQQYEDIMESPEDITEDHHAGDEGYSNQYTDGNQNNYGRQSRPSEMLKLGI